MENDSGRRVNLLLGDILKMYAIDNASYSDDLQIPKIRRFVDLGPLASPHSEFGLTLVNVFILLD